ncbi:MAG: hypothetical protein DRP09_13240 [Candidatus Thorarchaeota archaeon]|nr:MAG: hypothetical protein DRP09_13240 [Candidatus Thorarchaeota archaeon]
MHASRSDLKRRILLALDISPASVYDILYSLSDFSDPRRTRLPKLFRAMEREDLVTSALQPGPLGPYRRIYQPGPRAGDYLRERLRSGIETLLHFFLEYRVSSTSPSYDLPKEKTAVTVEGQLLYASFPTMTVAHLERIRKMRSSSDISISVVGHDNLLQKAGIRHTCAGQGLEKIDAPDETFDFAIIDGVPEQAFLACSMPEVCRVLAVGGSLRMFTTMAFFNEPQKATLEQFIRVTASTLFADVGIVEGQDVLRIPNDHFVDCRAFETDNKRVCFTGTKQ